MKEEPKIINVFTNHAVCPSCGCFVLWEWNLIVDHSNGYSFDPFGHYQLTNNDGSTRKGYRVCATQCSQCEQICIFHDGEMVYPRTTTHVKPHELFTNYSKSQKLFNESLAVASDSPRAGLTLSRMCLECLVNEILTELGERPSENFKANIGKLEELEIITVKTKKLLDNARVVGNKSTHNFNLIDTEKDVSIDDCIIVWTVCNRILDSLKFHHGDDNLENLVNKVK